MAELFRPLLRGLTAPLFEPGLGVGNGGGLPAGFTTSSLYHDYTRQQYVRAPAPSITRASTKTVLSSAGLLSSVASGALALSDRGLSIEESRTNLCLRSEEFTNASWTGGASFTADTAISPDGTMDADTLTASGGANQTVYQTITVTTGTVYTYSQFVKLGTMLSSEFTLAFYDATNAAFIAQGVAPSVTLVDTEWRRTIHTITTPAGCTSLRVYCFRGTATAGRTAFVWGAQFEAGSFATSYIPTTSATATRAADVVTIPSPTSYVSLAQGGAFVEWTDDVGPFSAERRIVLLLADISNFIRLRIGADNKIYAEVIAAGATVCSFASTGTVVAGTTYRLAARWAANDFAGAISSNIAGGGLQTDTVGAIPTGTLTIGLGHNQVGPGNFVNATIRRFALWQTGPSNAELQALVA